MYLSNGTLLQGGKYKIVCHISSGGFGNTYEGVHTMMNTRVAIKEFFPKMFCDRDGNTSHVIVATQGNRELVSKLRKKFNEEAKAIYEMKHDNIVRVQDSFEENGTAYYVMEYIDGKSLHDIVKERGALPEAEAVGYIRQVANALKYVHSLNRLHLDIKPANVIINKNGKAVLIDFGASKHYDMESGENTSTLMGLNTPGYAPIEQCTQSFTSFSPATDIYALGATLYKLLTGVTPPDAHLLSAKEEMLLPLPSSISDSTRKAVTAAMTLMRADRTQSVEKFVSQLGDEGTLIDKEPIPFPINIPWWKAEGLTPVSIWNIWGKDKKYPLLKFLLCFCIIAILIYIISVMAGSGVYYLISSRETENDRTICAICAGIFVFLLLSYIIFYITRPLFIPNILIKRRKELLQIDFIEEYDTRNEKYAIVARGTSGYRKYGLFDVKKLRLVVPFKYDRMQWDEPRKTLKVEIGSERFIIDTKDNEFQ